MKYQGRLPVAVSGPFVVAGCGDQASLVLERLAKERLLGTSLDASVERGRAQFLERLRPPMGHNAPTHAGEIAIAFVLDNNVHRVGGADIVARLQIVRWRFDRQPIEPHNLVPREFVREASAHFLNRRAPIAGSL